MNPAVPGQQIRPARQAGLFYEADATLLRRGVQAMLAQAPAAKLEGPPLGLVAPHAGYVYSGPVAAAAYRQLLGRPPDHVLLLAPAHSVDFTGAALPDAMAFATPLGPVAIDQPAAAALTPHAGFAIRNDVHDPEHAIEVQLPFLQTALDRPFTLLPLALGRPPQPDPLEALAGPLEELLEQRTAAGETWLILASTDTYHGHNGADCEANDARLARLIETLDAPGIIEGTRRRTVMACGWLALALAAELARRRGARRGQILERGDSRAAAGPRSTYVVGYLAAAFV